MSAVNKKHFQRIKELFQEIAKNNIYNFSDIELQEMKDTIDLLCSRGVLQYLEIDNANAYRKIGDFSIFDEWLHDTETQKKKEQNAERKPMIHKQYDVFISHASADKLDYVDKLYAAVKKLGVNVFYDKEVISWGDNWKQTILDGTEKSEFAIIVISENFFGREWTERELSEFLKRQNESGQKIVLPLLYNVSTVKMEEKYPSLGVIQAINSDKSLEEITILFAKELIKRLR